jgi:uncharacterized protein YbbC (DUF1343 family)/CubicO group peptidase (beta-lactamase class C family)
MSSRPKRWLVALAAMLLLPAFASPADLVHQDWTPIDAAVRAQIAAGQLPGAVMVFGDAGHVWLRRAWGRRATVPGDETMTPDTVFDLASLTKVVVTTTAVLQLVERGRLQLDMPVAHYWPAFGAYGKREITIRQLLAHRSGLRADLDLRPAWSGRDEALRRVCAEKLVAVPNAQTIYSDINFIVLGELVRRVTGTPLDVYARWHIFAPLGMRDTGFHPPAALEPRIAPTQMLAGMPLRGTVHDPTARRMGGVAGHAGLFGTADDLARFAQGLLRHRRVLSAASIAAMQSPQGPEGAPDARGLGWELAPPLVANRDDLVPLGGVGHTGYTGTGLWIDFVQGRFVVLLSNRVHPEGRGNAQPLRRQVLALLASLAPPLDAPVRATPDRPRVATGIDVLRAQAYAPLAGRRIGLITHLAAIDSRGWRTIDRLRWAPHVALVKLFSPEHGLYGDVEGVVPSGVEPFSGLPLLSLYGATRRPDAAMLQDIDTLVFDVQDAGARFFTYGSALAQAMEVSAENGLHFVVLDRPDPIRADRAGGPVLDLGRRSFTGQPGLPVQPGMTMGELARWFQAEIRSRRGLDVDLQVIAMQGYQRSMWFDQTGLDWVPPSPNLRTPGAAALYPGVGMIEGANVSVGRGTPHPFERLGAPWIDAERLAEALNDRAPTGLRFAAIEFTPDAGPFNGQLCHGVRIEVLDRDSLDAPLLGTLLASTLFRLWPQEFKLDAIDSMLGSQQALQELRDGIAPSTMAAHWQPRLDEFRALRERMLLY